MSEGRVIGIYITPRAATPTRPVDRVRAVPGRGLEGDRYFEARGTWSAKPKPGREVTLIESEAIDAVRRDHGIDVPASAARRNLVTRGVPLNHLVGREFTVGAVHLRGIRLCEPCSHMEELAAAPGLRKALVHRGGLRAEILTAGFIGVGDPVRVLAETAAE